MIAAEEVDIAAVGRALVADPGWVMKLQTGLVDLFVPYSREALKQLV